MNINNFGPFYAEVWGTVSDWAMVIVTGTTLYYIFKTFNSQYKVQKLQQQSTNIENERFRIEIYPKFEMSIIKKDFTIVRDEVKIELWAEFQLIQNECLNLHIDMSSLATENISYKVISNKLDYISEKAHRVLDINVLVKKNIFDAHGCNISANFEYTDMIGNGYTLDFLIHLTFTDSGIDTIGPYRILEKN